MPRSTDALQGIVAQGGEAPVQAPGQVIDGDDFRRLLRSGTTWLERNAVAVDALNVFPVPDGDTGTNMLLTMRAAVEGAHKVKGSGAAQAMKGAAQGAVMGARGNSGVILSQIVAGIARGLGDQTTCDGNVLARALAEGAATAYRAVTRPVEGTILTVARAAGEGAAAAVKGSPGAVSPSIQIVLEGAVSAALDAVQRTPQQLPLLQQAGVVDAGGEGYRIILEGMAFAVAGTELPESAATTSPATLIQGTEGTESTRPAVAGIGAGVAPERLIGGPTEAGEEWGYCTQFVIHAPGLNIDDVRREIQDIAESALVVGDESLVRVHGHTEDPGRLLTYAVRHGRLERVSIEDMDVQHDAWLRSQVETAAVESAAQDADNPTPEEGQVAAASVAAMSVASAVVAAVATVAVAPGPGIADVFRSLGAGEIVLGGQTMNPSTNDILEAAEKTGARAVLVLPNNSRILLAAHQAATVAAERTLQLLVVPTRTVPQGVAAQLAFRSEATPEENAKAMADAAEGVATVEVTRATRSVTIDDVSVEAGDFLALLDDVVVAATDDPITAATQALDQGGAERAEIITVYRGDSPAADAAERFAGALRERYPQAEIELVLGGQPHYDYLIAVE
ncbi:MAG: DAK2 domain-containing protein [Chloroflexota bacterium]|nr:DAK2 domain-containing protein [Chloroflexota bacterium]